MNFGAFTQSLKKSAALAAEAAQKLDFDKMAANDDYIHTTDDNVERRKSPVETNTMDDTSTLSTHSSLLDRHRHPQRPTSVSDPRLARATRNLVPLKVDVPERRRKIIPEDSLSSEESEDEDDPIYALLKKQKPKSEMGVDAAAEAALSTTNSSETEIKKHRFFEDLENRIALPPKEMPDGILSETTKAKNHAPDPPEPSPVSLPPWLSAAASALKLQRTQHNTGGAMNTFTRPAFFRKKPEAAQDELANVAVVSGAAVLGDAELEQLAALGKRQEQNYLHFMMEVITHHPREIFILFTLCLSGFVYLFAKNRSWVI